MKTLFKISFGFSLLSLLAVLIVPIVVSADTQDLSNKCVIRADFTGLSGTISNNCPVQGSDSLYDKMYKAQVAVDSGGIVSGAVCCLMSTIYYVTNWIFLILMGIAVIMVIIGGFFMVTAAGNPEGFAKGRTLIIYALVGVVVALLAKFIPGVAKFIVG